MGPVVAPFRNVNRERSLAASRSAAKKKCEEEEDDDVLSPC